MDWFNANVAYPGMQHRLEECEKLNVILQDCKRERGEAMKEIEKGDRGWFAIRGTKKKGGEEVKKLPSCNVAEHKLWSCRAMALGCVEETNELRRCRRDKGGECEEQQRMMGKCIMEKRRKMKDWVIEQRKKGV